MIDETRWKHATEEALEDEQIVAALQRRDIRTDFLVAEVNATRDEISSQIVEARAEEERALRAIASAENEILNLRTSLTAKLSDVNPATTAEAIRDLQKVWRNETGAKAGTGIGLRHLAAALVDGSPQTKKQKDDSWPMAVWIFLFGVASVALIAFVISIVWYLVVDWRTVFDSIAAPNSVAKWAGLISVSTFAGGLAFIGISEAFFKSPFEKEKERLKPRIREIAVGVGESAQNLEGALELGRKLHDSAVARTDVALAAAIAAHLRAAIDRKRQPIYDDGLPNIDLTGLSEVLNAHNIVDTKTRDELVDLMGSMPGGSIGIGGPRGAGKSTLISQITHVETLRHNDGTGMADRKVLGVFSSAPVKYDGRDFILYLFSAVCDKVLAPHLRQGNARQWEEAFASRERREPFRLPEAIWATAARASRLLRTGAIALILSGVAVTFLPKPPTAPAPPIVFQINGTEVKMPAPEKDKAPTPGWLAVLHQLAALPTRVGVQPWSLLVLGVECLVAALLLNHFLRRTEPVDEHAPMETSTPRRAGIAPPPGQAGDIATWDAVTKSAAEWDIELRYQQSFTSGWSGALKLPVGFDMTTSRSSSLIARQMTFPELTRAFRDFLETLAPWFVVVIGIDELDKIATADKAHEFVNEVKAIFGIRGVFYLVSVSDSAMSSFARRGLPVRDAFDSAFDEIVRIDYMDHAQAKRVLSRRVIGLPEPIVSFCLCLSGGLPRDLIRICRALFTDAKETGSRKLGQLARSLLRRDLLEKIDGSLTHVLDLGAGSAAATVVFSMRGLRHAVEEGADLQPPSQALMDSAAAMATTAATNGDGVRRSIADTAADLAVYAVYCATVYDAFTMFPAEEAWRLADDAKVFSHIASFRRSLSVSSQSTNAEIAVLRTTWQMTELRLG